MCDLFSQHKNLYTKFTCALLFKMRRTKPLLLNYLSLHFIFHHHISQLTYTGKKTDCCFCVPVVRTRLSFHELLL